MTSPRVMIAGGGIGGLSLTLTLHQIGVDCVVFESVRDLKPLGVDINLQPNAVRELFDLGIGSDELDKIGVPAKEWALVGLNGQEIYSEPRGTLAGYRWPQYAVHRGEFHKSLHRRLSDLSGEETVRLGSRVTGYDINPRRYGNRDCSCRRRRASRVRDVIPADEHSAFMASYQQAAGFAKAPLNASPPIIVPGAKVTN